LIGFALFGGFQFSQASLFFQTLLISALFLNPVNFLPKSNSKLFGKRQL
jgi:hypothetical protein